MTPRQADTGVALAAATMAASVALALAGLVAQLTGANPTVANAAPVRAPPPRRAAPVASTPLALELRGLMLARPAAASVALIATSGGTVVAYAIGETLPGGGVLDAVEYDLAVVRVDGRVQTLSFPVASRGAPVAAQAIPDAAPEPAQGQETLLASLGASATPDGYRLGTALSPAMRAVGLLPGDVVAGIDGQAVGDPARDRAILDAMVVAGRARIEAVRDGQRMTVDIPIR